MVPPTKYMLVALPLSVSSSEDAEEVLSDLDGSVNHAQGTVHKFSIPELKVGSLDTLMAQSDELGKLESTCAAVVGKVEDALKNILEGDEDKIRQQKTVNDRPVQTYLQNFAWNKVKYRSDKPIRETANVLQKEINSIDNDVKNKYGHWTTTKTNLNSLEKKQSGNLLTKSLVPIISNPSDLLPDSEYLQTHLIVFPKSQTKKFLSTYETLCPMVVPRSANPITSDDEFILFSVITFKKTSNEFLAKCREQRWTPREFKSRKGGQESEKKELEQARKDERKLWGEALRLGRTAWGEAIMCWMHVLAVRMFVESILRYGLPPMFVGGIVKTTPKLQAKVKAGLDDAFSYLGGAVAVSRDKKGRIKKDDGSMANDMAAAGMGGGDSAYTPYVYFEFEIR